MKKLLIGLLLISAKMFAQGNLEFNQVLTFEPGDNYTVPAGKVLKIESISSNGSSVCLPKTSTTTVNCLTQNGTVQVTCGVYSGIDYLRVGNLVYAIPSQNGCTGYGGSNGCPPNPNPTCFPVSVTVPSISTPLWLEEGKVVNIFSGTYQLLISALEFNIVP